MRLAGRVRVSRRDHSPFPHEHTHDRWIGNAIRQRLAPFQKRKRHESPLTLLIHPGSSFPAAPAHSTLRSPEAGQESHVHRGSCLCESIQYEIESDLKAVVNCHCKFCSKAHGAPFTTLLFMPFSRLG